MRGNYSLSRSVLSGSSSAGPMDTVNIDKIKYRNGGIFEEGDEVADLYDATGNMRVARTLANYRKPRAQGGAYVPSDPNYGIRDKDKEGRVFHDAADLAKQKAMENKDTPFQNALASHEKAWKPGMDNYFMWKGKPIAIASAQGGGAGNAGTGGGTFNPDSNGLIGMGGIGQERFRTLDAQLNPKGTFTEQGAQPGTQSGTEENVPGANWWDMNKSGLGDAFGDVVEGYGNIWPHLANIKDYKELPGVTAPMLQRGVPLERPSLESYKQAIIAQGRNAQNQAGYDTAQSGQQAGQRAQFLAETQGQLSKLAGYEGNLKADIANKERMANSQIDANNIKSVNQYYDDITERDLYQTQGIANERQMIAKNILGFTGGQRQRKLDRQNMAMINQRFKHEGIKERALEDAIKKGNWKAVSALQSGQGILT